MEIVLDYTETEKILLALLRAHGVGKPYTEPFQEAVKELEAINKE
jgi:hypothetical protein